jgi:hypothetical protein
VFNEDGRYSGIAVGAMRCGHAKMACYLRNRVRAASSDVRLGSESQAISIRVMVLVAQRRGNSAVRIYWLRDGVV